MHFRRLVPLAVIAAAIFVFTPAAASAGPIYAVDFSAGGSEFGDAQKYVSGGAPLSSDLLVSTSGSSVSGEAQAGAGFLGVGSIATATETGFNALIESTAAFGFDDLIVSGPGSGSISATLWLDLSGDLIADMTGIGWANADIDVTGQFGDTLFGGHIWRCESPEGLIIIDCHGVTSGSNGVFASSVDTSRVIGIPVILPVNQAFSMELSLEAMASASKFNSVPHAPGAVSASSDYFHTLSFLSGSPVLTLPSGYTFNSVEAGITNNQWGNSAPVPEPASAMLFGVGLLCVARRARRRI